MKIAVDTNVLVRTAVRDDVRQASVAFRLLRDASTIAIGLACLCEFVWVVKGVYGFSSSDAAMAIRRLLDAENVEVNRPAVEAGLVMLDSGGEFADGVIAAEGRWMGGETFVSFDRKAIAKLTAQHHSARLLSGARTGARRAH
jgi:predicted nucleic-acid-binding protein